MRYMLLIYDNEASWAALSEAEQAECFAEYMAVSADVAKVGQMVSAAPLQPTSTATTVRVKDGRVLTTDGPFAETREQLGGYYLVDAPSLDDALAIAARLPGARYGAVEVRPILEVPASAMKAASA